MTQLVPPANGTPPVPDTVNNTQAAPPARPSRQEVLDAIQKTIDNRAKKLHDKMGQVLPEDVLGPDVAADIHDIQSFQAEHRTYDAIVQQFDAALRVMLKRAGLDDTAIDAKLALIHQAKVNAKPMEDIEDKFAEWVQRIMEKTATLNSRHDAVSNITAAHNSPIDLLLRDFFLQRVTQIQQLMLTDGPEFERQLDYLLHDKETGYEHFLEEKLSDLVLYKPATVLQATLSAEEELRTEKLNHCGIAKDAAEGLFGVRLTDQDVQDVADGKIKDLIAKYNTNPGWVTIRIMRRASNPNGGPAVPENKNFDEIHYFGTVNDFNTSDAPEFKKARDLLSNTNLAVRGRPVFQPIDKVLGLFAALSPAQSLHVKLKVEKNDQNPTGLLATEIIGCVGPDVIIRQKINGSFVEKKLNPGVPADAAVLTEIVKDMERGARIENANVTENPFPLASIRKRFRYGEYDHANPCEMVNLFGAMTDGMQVTFMSTYTGKQKNWLFQTVEVDRDMRVTIDGAIGETVVVTTEKIEENGLPERRTLNIASPELLTLVRNINPYGTMSFKVNGADVDFDAPVTPPAIPVNP
jgi:hypothetical protein